MEIERKFLIPVLPENLECYSSHEIEQGYLCREPVVRIRRQDEEWILTYKSKGMMVREEYNLPLTREAYEHLKEKTDGLLIEKTRYLIPLESGLTVELDVFHGAHEGLCMAEVEFPDRNMAEGFEPPEWFGEEVTFSGRYHNSKLSENPL